MFENKLEFKGAVIGMVLGDGCLPKGRKTTHLQMSHKAADKKYIEMKAKMLEYLTEVKIYEGISTLNEKEYPYISARTLSHPFYNSLYEHMYYDGRKTVDEHVMKCLTPLGLALFYLDDGVFQSEQGVRNPYICSHNFNKVENELMCRMIHKKFGITFRTINKNIGGKSYYWMRLRRKDTEKFFDIIRKYVPECMKRKIDASLYESDEKYRRKEFRHCNKCGNEFDVVFSSQALTCKVCQLKSMREGHRLYYDEKVKVRETKCIQCGKVFYRKPGKNTSHCSKTCSGISHSSFWKNKRGDHAQA